MLMARRRTLCVLSFSLGTIALPTGLIALVHRGSLAGVLLILAGMALLVQGLEETM